jgi:hypothetical protein
MMDIGYLPTIAKDIRAGRTSKFGGKKLMILLKTLDWKKQKK